MLLHQRGLTATYLRLPEACIVNVGTAVCLPPHRKVAADRASGDRTPSGRGSVVVAGVTSRRGDGNTGHRAKGASPTATPME